MKDSAWERLGSYLKETQILGSIQNTLYWDQNTVMPKQGALWRAEQLAYMAKKLHQRNSSKELGVDGGMTPSRKSTANHAPGYCSIQASNSATIPCGGTP